MAAWKRRARSLREHRDRCGETGRRKDFKRQARGGSAPLTVAYRPDPLPW